MLLVLAYICLVLTKNSNSPVSCNKELGTYVLNFVVHVNKFEAQRIRMYKNDFQKAEEKVLKEYFDSIFNSINRSLNNYGVQIVGDYNQLSFEMVDPSLKPDDVCKLPSISPFIAGQAVGKMSWPKTPGVGNRIIVYSCPMTPYEQIEYANIPANRCGNVLSVYNEDPALLEKIIMDQVQAILTRRISVFSDIESESYNKSLCNYVTSCAENNDLIGKFHPGVKNVRQETFTITVEDS